MIPTVEIKYIDEEVIKITADEWDTVRAEGVDEIIMCNPLPIHCSGHSLYWLYKDGDNYVLGGASPYIPEKIAEVLFTVADLQVEREIDYMPDLLHKDIKLGWWREGKEY